ncbi:MAG: TRAP transporter small permease subunit [Gammaproteobacteria bacterium]|nr:TRAP transporter small permease subunit [Gammaproteobacteria bacterium]
MRPLGERIDSANRILGEALSWLTGFMVLVTFVVVVLRYAFDTGWIWLQESVTWMHALVFMLAAAYTLGCDEHVRVDIFYRRMDARKKALVHLLGALFLLAPTWLLLIFVSWDYVAASWAVFESSREAGGLPGLFLLKSIIPLTAVLLLLQGLSQALSGYLAATSRSQQATPEDQADRGTGL